MPLRYVQRLAAPPVRRCGVPVRPLHSTPVLRGDHGDAEAQRQNHYEALNLHPGATPADVKRSFYALSKSHHPDHNPADPSAPRRFMRLAEAYAVLSHPVRRAAYDRDVLRLHQHPHQHHRRADHARGRAGSYSSAGGRPASGLSRRRGTFQGPPPSFFRSGGWGAQAAKRGAAHDESTGGAGRAQQQHPRRPEEDAAGAAGGMGPGQDPLHGTGRDVPHFDRRAHERTQRQILERLAARRRGGGGPGTDYGMAANYVVAAGLLLVAVVWQPWWDSGEKRKKEGEKKKKG